MPLLGDSTLSFGSRGAPAGLRLGSRELAWAGGTGHPKLTGVRGWFDASLVEADEGARVTSWADSSGNGVDLATEGIGPTMVSAGIGGKPALSFGDATLDTSLFLATFAATDPYYLAVFTREEATGADALIGSRDSGARADVYINTEWAMYSSIFVGTVISTPLSVAQSIRAKFGVEGYLEIMGGAKALMDMGETVMSGLSLGAMTADGVQFGWFGLIAEAVILDAEPSVEELADWDAYVADKYGIS